MAIQKNSAGGGNNIREAGEYVVEVSKLETGKSKKGKQMLTVVFETHDERKINAYFVKEILFHMAHLTNLKLAAGLKPESSAEELLGRRVGILVEMREPDEQGRVFSQIVGYGPAKDVTPREPGEAHDAGGHFAKDDAIPF